MLEPTNYLDNLNKRIEISSSEIGNVHLKESFVLNSRRNALDFANIGAYINEVIVNSYSTLCSLPRYPKDAVAHGISGMTIPTWLESDGNNRFNEEVFWFKATNEDAEGRPCTIKESIQFIWSNLTPLIRQEQRAGVDLSPLENALGCLETKVTRLKTDVFGSNFVLNCNDSWVKQKWPVSKHVYEILKQLTVGHDINEIEGLNDVNNPLYPDLNWAIALEDLLDVDVSSVPPVGGDSLIWNEESNTWQPGNSDVKYITELRDVNTAAYTLQENDILVWDPTAKDDQAAEDGEEGAWIPVASSSLLQGSSVEYIDELLDVDSSGSQHGDVLTWDKHHIDSTDPNNTSGGAWVPKPLPAPVVPTIDKIEEGDSSVEVVDTDSETYINIETDNVDRWRFEAGGHLIPQSNAAYDIGEAENKVRHLFLSDNSLFIGDNSLGADNGALKWNESFSIPHYSGVPSINQILKWDGNAWVLSEDNAESGSGTTVLTKNYEQCHLGGFTKEIPYNGSIYQVGPGESPVMFLFKNNTGATLKLKDFSFTCTEMYSTQIEFSFVKAPFTDLAINQYETISNLFTMGKMNIDTNTSDQGIGIFEGDLQLVPVNDKEYFGLLLNTYEKVGLDNSNFFLNLEATN